LPLKFKDTKYISVIHDMIDAKILSKQPFVKINHKMLFYLTRRHGLAFLCFIVLHTSLVFTAFNMMR